MRRGEWTDASHWFARAANDYEAIGDLAGLAGAVLGAGGVGVVAVLVLRAMAEWDTIVETGDPAAARRAEAARRARS